MNYDLRFKNWAGSLVVEHCIRIAGVVGSTPIRSKK